MGSKISNEPLIELKAIWYTKIINIESTMHSMELGVLESVRAASVFVSANLLEFVKR